MYSLVVHSAPEQEQCLLAGLIYAIPNTEITEILSLTIYNV